MIASSQCFTFQILKCPKALKNPFRDFDPWNFTSQPRRGFLDDRKCSEQGSECLKWSKKRPDKCISLFQEQCLDRCPVRQAEDEVLCSGAELLHAQRVHLFRLRAAVMECGKSKRCLLCANRVILDTGSVRLLHLVVFSGPMSAEGVLPSMNQLSHDLQSIAKCNTMNHNVHITICSITVCTLGSETFHCETDAHAQGSSAMRLAKLAKLANSGHVGMTFEVLASCTFSGRKMNKTDPKRPKFLQILLSCWVLLLSVANPNFVK